MRPPFAEEEPAGSFVTLLSEEGVQVKCVARFLAAPNGPELGAEALGGWDTVTATAPPAPTLSLTLSVAANGRIVRFSRTALSSAPIDAPADGRCGRMISRAGHGRARRRARGFTLIELLIGASIAAVILSAAYAWLWNIGAFADGADEGAQAATLAAAVTRAVAADIYAGVGVVEPPSGPRSLAVARALHDHVAGAPEAVLIVWDPARGVVWRNASGTYLADHVSGFDIAYALADGSLVDGGDMTSS